MRRIVFERGDTSAPPQDLEAAFGPDLSLALADPSEDYAKVIAGLDKVRATLRSAREARQLTFL